MTGTLINVTAILAGSVLGITLGSRLPEGMRDIAMHGLGLVTSLIGLQMSLQTQNVLILLGALLLGGVLGEILMIDENIERLGNFLQSMLSSGRSGRFSEAFVTTSLLFCVGPMAILGAIQDGLSGDYSLLTIKASLDGIAAVAFAAGLGWGVSFSALSILLYQGSLTLFAGLFDKVLTQSMITEMSATGGLIIVGIGLKLLDLKHMRLANFLPALALAPLLTMLLPILKAYF